MTLQSGFDEGILDLIVVTNNVTSTEANRCPRDIYDEQPACDLVSFDMLSRSNVARLVVELMTRNNINYIFTYLKLS